MKPSHLTPNLILDALRVEDAPVLAELMNSPDWPDGPGDRKFKTDEDVRNYVREIDESPLHQYWLVKQREPFATIGVVTFTKRAYLDHFDIGFEFLSEFTRDEFAIEAVTAVLEDVMHDPRHSHILAIAKQDNPGSKRILEKLGLPFEKKISIGKDHIQVYSNTVDKLQLNQITTTFFGLFKNTGQHRPDFGKIHELCLPETIIIKKGSDNEEVFNIDTFIEPRKKILTDGTLTEFEEYEISEDTTVMGHIAQRISRYEKKGYVNGSYFEGRGNKLFQFVKTNNGWKIVSICWEDDGV
jgi:RimJ/RimL family protein N-acetyltransferase